MTSLPEQDVNATVTICLLLLTHSKALLTGILEINSYKK